MTIAKNRPAKSKPMTLEEYMNYNDGTDFRRELWDGRLVDMGAESNINVVIGTFLIVVLSRLIPYQRIQRGTEVEVKGKLANARLPDLLILTDKGTQVLKGKARSLVTLDMPAPSLAVEIVSSSNTDKRSRERDYISKRREYAEIGIAEYWIIDPIADIVLVLSLQDATYAESQFALDQKLTSVVFPDLNLTAQQVLAAEM